MSALRTALGQLQPGEVQHLGLALARYLPADDQEKGRRSQFVTALAGDGSSQAGAFGQSRGDAAYARAFGRWQRAAQSSGLDTRVLTLACTGRSVVGLGTDTPLENGLTTHHTYGVPMLPGSALKGLAASFAARHYEGWARGVPDGPHARLFGADAQKASDARSNLPTGHPGTVTFLDALPQPGRWALHREVMTVHHQGYYGGAQQPPADWDMPVPVPFLSVSGTFTAVLTAERSEHSGEALDAAAELLRAALAEEGLGAKTSSGFGRFTVEVQAQAAGAPSRTPDVRLLPTWLETDLNASWKPRDLANPGGKMHATARRLLKEAQEGTLPPTQAREAATRFLAVFTAANLDRKVLRGFKWHAEMADLASGEAPPA